MDIFVQLLLITFSLTYIVGSRTLLDNGGGSAPVTMAVDNNHVVLDNGIITVMLTNPGGAIAGIKYGGIDDIMRIQNGEGYRGYWDLNWAPNMNDPLHILSVVGTKMDVIQTTSSIVEVSFKMPWDNSNSNIPLNIDLRYIMQSGKSGVYAYVIFSKPSNFPAAVLVQNRLTVRLTEDKFTQMWMSDWKHRDMPTEEDVTRGIPLAYKEAVLIVNSKNPALNNEVSDKYQYLEDTKDINVHGWVSQNPSIGYWHIFPSHEFQNGGPMKQQLTVQAGPINLAVFGGGHLMMNNSILLQNGERWEKIYGPIFLYMNTGSDANSLWQDAKRQLRIESASWPYGFVQYENYLKKPSRASVNGKLSVLDSAINGQPIPAKSAFIGLAAPGVSGSWQMESKGYQFWTNTDAQGNFVINNIVPGTYNVYAYVPGVIGDYVYEKTLQLTSGQRVSLNNLVYTPPRAGPTLWEIGIADRTCEEFFIPDVPQKYMNKLYVNKEKWRQYGIWETYSDVYKNGDLVFNVGKSNYASDWYYAQVSMNGNKATTWTINFTIDKLVQGTYALRISVAASDFAHLEVHFNNRNARPDFSVELKATDNAIARHGSHGRYQLLEFLVNSNLLVNGQNSLYLTQTVTGTFTGIMYDYLRFEAPSS